MNIDKIVQEALNKKRKYRRKKPKNKQANIPRPNFTKQELIQYLKDNNIQDSNTLRDKATTRTTPNYYDYKKTFGSFTQAKQEAFPSTHIIKYMFKPKTDQEIATLILKAIIRFALYKQTDYHNTHLKFQEAVPSIYHVKRIFGQWSKAVKYAYKTDAGKQFIKYVQLFSFIQQRPNLKQLDEAQISLPTLIQAFETRDKLDEMTRIMMPDVKNLKKRIRKKHNRKKKK